MSDLVLARNCCLARMVPGEAENGVGMNRSVREGNGLDTALYKTIFFLLLSYNEIRQNWRQHGWKDGK